jgi:ABC-2 type transport system permease protein
MRNLKLEASAPARTAALSLYPRVFTTALRSQMKYLTAIMIRNLFFVMVLFIFTSIWRVAYAGRELIAGFTMVQILWYLSFTEVVEMSKSRLMTPIQEEVKEGTIAYNLLRPYDYIWFYLVRGSARAWWRWSRCSSSGVWHRPCWWAPCPDTLRTSVRGSC